MQLSSNWSRNPGFHPGQCEFESRRLYQIINRRIIMKQRIVYFEAEHLSKEGCKRQLEFVEEQFAKADELLSIKIPTIFLPTKGTARVEIIHL